MALENSKNNGPKKNRPRLKMKHNLELACLSVRDWAAEADVSDQAIYDFINGITQNSPRIEDAYKSLRARRKAA